VSLGELQKGLRLGEGLPLTTMHRLFKAIALSALLHGSAPAYAHAHLERASPPAGAILRAPPSEVSLWFSQKLEPAFSSAQVHDSYGVRVDQGARIDEANPTLIHVPLKLLVPGAYSVHWRVLSVDSHTTEGDFTFRVEP
jgi:methionine-rich copper-binding protein CopC